MRLIYLLFLAFTNSCFSVVVKIRGRELVFSSNHTGRRLSSASNDNDVIWYVRSGSSPPPGCIAEEAVAPGVYLARGDASIEFARGVWIPEMKYDPNMRTQAISRRFPNFGVIVRTDSEFYNREDCKTEKASRGRFYISCDIAVPLSELAKDPRVLWISEIPVIKFHSYESQILMMGENSPYNGSGIRIAVSDTGLDYKHCAFYESGSNPPLGSVDANRQKVVGILKTWNSDYVALTGAHGTMTAGIAAGYACMSDRSGVAPQSKLWFLDNSDNDEYVHVPDDFDDLILNSGASVHSASWGSYSHGRYSDLDSIFDGMQRTNPTLCQIRSAGNDGPTGIVSATSKNGLVVGACLSKAADFTEFSSSQRQQQPDLYSHTSQIDFSSKGPAADGRLSPHVCAPGYRVWGPYALNPSTSDHASYTRGDGTSFSAPAIAGIVANLQQRWKNMNSGSLPQCALIEAALMAHAVKPTRVVERVGNTLRVVAGAPAISTLGTPLLDFTRWSDVNDGSVTSSSRQAFCFENEDEEAYTIVMRWTDVSASAGTSAPLINDLDMFVTGSTGETRVADDEINNFEMIQDWTAQHTRVIVFAYDEVTTFGDQSFAIHVKGKTRRVECASTILPSEFTECAEEGSGSYRAVNSWTGSTSCDFRVCPLNTCGADCARTCTESPCAVAQGSGYLDPDGVCRPHTCNEYTFVTDTSCKCRLGTAKPCNNGHVARCLEDGSFATCPESFSSSIIDYGIATSSSSSSDPPLFASVATATYSFLLFYLI
jgi:subtilisin family serine protease